MKLSGAHLMNGSETVPQKEIDKIFGEYVEDVRFGRVGIEMSFKKYVHLRRGWKSPTD